MCVCPRLELIDFTFIVILVLGEVGNPLSRSVLIFNESISDINVVLIFARNAEPPLAAARRPPVTMWIAIRIRLRRTIQPVRLHDPGSRISAEVKQSALPSSGRLF